jgi:uncharacterized protein (TIGR02284 family)
MKYSEKTIGKLKQLMMINDEAEKIYLYAISAVSKKSLKAFFSVRVNERRAHVKLLSDEIKRLNGNLEDIKTTKADFPQVYKYLKKMLLKNNENDLLEAVYFLEKRSIDKFNAVLSEPGLPLSTCKILIKQKDTIEASLYSIKRREDELVA